MLDVVSVRNLHYHRFLTLLLAFAMVLVQAMVLQHRIAHVDGVHHHQHAHEERELFLQHHTFEHDLFPGHDSGDKLACAIVDHVAADLFLFGPGLLSACAALHAYLRLGIGITCLSVEQHYRAGARAPPTFFS